MAEIADTANETPAPSQPGMPADLAAARLSRIDLTILVAAGVAGLVLRIWILISPLGALFSDEAIVGLMARHLLHQHDFPIFFWGQPYGGSIEPILTAGLFGVVGSSTLALKAVPLALAATGTALFVPVATRLAGRRAAVYAAAAFWLGPATFVWWSTKAAGFYWACLNLGLLFLLLAMRIGRGGERWHHWAGLGLIGGLGWWTTPQILYFAIPALTWLAVRRGKDVVRGAVIAALPFLAGALPWIVYNVRQPLASLTFGSSKAGLAVDRLVVFFTRGLPTALGLIADQRWLLPVAAQVLYLVVLAVVVWGLVRRPKSGLLIGMLVAYPLIFGALPTLPDVGEGRYLLFLSPFLWLALVRALRRRPLALLFLAAVLGLTVVGLAIVKDVNVANAGGRRMPNDDRALVSFLERHRVKHLSANYWIAYRVAFETEERVVAGAFNPSQDRFPPYAEEVSRSVDRAYAFVWGTADEAEFTRRYGAVLYCFSRHVLGDFVVYLPLCSGR